MRITINLASQPFEDAQRFVRQWTLTLGLVGLLTLVLVVGAVLRLRSWSVEERRIHDLQAQMAQGDREIGQAEAFLNRPENRDTRDKSLILNDLIARKAFSWTEVFSDLERIMPPRLHVVSIRPELTPDNQLALRMMVAGESRERALELVRHMEQSPRFRQPQIVAEARQEQPQDPGDRVQFDITALYAAEATQQAPSSGTPPSTSQGGF
ncbi:MAG TPA: PilN domain-containing protein [Terriglobales bacterium]|nr:PilN domain-containing protein [Terriglobales bacterium]